MTAQIWDIEKQKQKIKKAKLLVEILRKDKLKQICKEEKITNWKKVRDAHPPLLPSNNQETTIPLSLSFNKESTFQIQLEYNLNIFKNKLNQWIEP